MPSDQAKFKALAAVITAHRDQFSSDEITLVQGGGLDPIIIKPTDMMRADTFKSQVDAKQADYDADQAAKDAKPDPSAAKVDALNQALQNLLPDGAATIGGDTTDAKTAYAILTKKRYGDDQDTSDDNQPGTVAPVGQGPDPAAQAAGFQQSQSVAIRP